MLKIFGRTFFFVIPWFLAVAPNTALGATTIPFNSVMHLKLYARGTDGAQDRLIGTTPAVVRPLRMVRGGFYYVRPTDDLTVQRLDQLAALVRQYSLSGLDLSGHAELTDDSVRRLQSLSGLQMLDLSETPLTDRGIAALKPLRGLAILIAPEALSDRSLETLSAFPHLQELSLDRTQVTNAGLNDLSTLPSLERLDISATPIDDRGMPALAQSPNLRHVILNNAITDRGAAALKKAALLEELDLSQTQIGAAGIKELAGLPHLLTLYVGKQFDDAAAKHLARSPSLRTLDLTRSSITDAGVKELRRLKTLQELALSQTHVGNLSVPYLAELPDLRMLELSETGITSAGLTPLAASAHLEIISLSWTYLNQDDLQGLAHLAHLQTIVLNGVPLPPTTMAELRRLGYKPPKALGPLQPVENTPVVEVTPAPLKAQPIDLSGTAVVAHPPSGEPMLRSKNTPPTLAAPAPLQAPAAFTDIAASQPQNPRSAAGQKNAAQLLKTIVDQSNPSRGGGFSSLAELKQVRLAGANGRLSDIIVDPKQAAIANEEDKPENSLGEMEIGAKHGR